MKSNLFFVSLFLFFSLIISLFIGFVGAQSNLGVPTTYPQGDFYNFLGNQIYPLWTIFGSSADVTGDNFNEILILDSGFSFIVDMIANTFVSGPVLTGGSKGDIDGLSDINGDGFDEFLIGQGVYGIPPYFGGIVRAYDGATNAVLYTVSDAGITWASGPDFFGDSVSVIGDVNGNGKEDFVVGAYGSNNFTGKVFVFDGLGSLLYTLTSLDSTDVFFGRSVILTGDVNSDGLGDFMVASSNLITGSLKAYVFSGTNGVLIHTLNIPWSGGSYIPYSPVFPANGKADYNLDGYNDFFVGNPGHTNAGVIEGRIYIFSGLDGTLLNQINAPAGMQEIATFFDVGDFNGDFYGDVVTRYFDSSNVLNVDVIYSGPNNLVLNSWIYSSPSPESNIPFVAGDFDNDFIDEAVFSGTFQSTGTALPDVLYVKKLGGVVSYGSGSIGLNWNSLGSYGAGGSFTVNGLQANEQAFVVLSYSPADVLLPSGDRAYVDVGNILGTYSFQADASGNLIISPINLKVPQIAGQKIYTQVAVVRNGVAYTSNGAEITFLG
ncbi:MAG: integrin alpha [Candidatus Pacearchaeota archaeon]|nr:integrin alpha [Candidatus Pacearchaeota archaeon]